LTIGAIGAIIRRIAIIEEASMLGAIVRRAIILSVVAARIMFAQSAAVPKPSEPPKYVPTAVQTLSLQVLQARAQTAQVQMQRVQDALQSAQKNFQDALAALNKAADDIKVENKWPAEVSFSPDQLTYTAPSPKPLAAAEPPKEKGKP
jgi:hypothetical protein